MYIPYKKTFIFFILSLSAISVSLPHTSKGGVYDRPKSSYYGIASWYGPGFHGRRTANGEVFNQNELTAAHKTLPFNTKVLVTNPKNNKSIVVRINDRGPFIGKRIIDLSEEAARKLDSKKDGLAYVKVEILNSVD